MTPIEEKELPIYRQIEQLLKENRDSLLTDVVPSKCNCSHGVTNRVFRCPGAFQINMLLESLNQIRLSRG